MLDKEPQYTRLEALGQTIRDQGFLKDLLISAGVQLGLFGAFALTGDAGSTEHLLAIPVAEGVRILAPKFFRPTEEQVREQAACDGQAGVEVREQVDSWWTRLISSLIHSQPATGYSHHNLDSSDSIAFHRSRGK